MNEIDIGAEQGFYQAVAEALGCDHDYKQNELWRLRRWNRTIGNGRYSGHGLVRRYSATCIMVQLTNPNVMGLYTSAQEALEAIKAAIGEKLCGPILP